MNKTNYKYDGELSCTCSKAQQICRSIHWLAKKKSINKQAVYASFSYSCYYITTYYTVTS